MENTKINTREDENYIYVKNIAQDIEAYADSDMYKCPHCDAKIDIKDYDVEHDDEDPCLVTCPECEEQFDIMDADHCDMWDYFEDCLDIEFRIDGRRQYKSVCITVTCGGPNVYVDTGSGRVELYWWGERAEYGLSKQAADLIDECFEQLYDDLC